MSAGVKKPEEETDAPSTSAENDSSIVLEIEYKGQPYGLMTSDAGAAVLKDVTEGKTYSFLKVPHHGSKTGLDEELIRQLAPKTAFLPVGENKHGHPAIEILELLRDVKARTFCSSKTPNCRKDCRRGGFGTISHRKDKAGHDGWISVTPGQCANNLPAVG
jgi:beta-lactamase superfamily II metal-dependent hydrolase